MSRFIGFLIIIGGLTGIFFVYKDYAAKTKQKRNAAAEEIRRVIKASLAAEDLDASEDPWFANEGAVFRILSYLHEAEKSSYNVTDTLKSAVAGSGARVGEGKLIVDMLSDNYSIAKKLGVFDDLSNLLKMEQGRAPTARAKGWEDEVLAVGHVLTPVLAPEAATSLANLVLMPATARDMQNDDLNGFGYEQSKKWLSEQIITPDSMRAITERLDSKNKKLY